MKAGVHEPTYRSWQMMKNRCTNPRAADYRYYGGRGIFLAPTWFEYDGFLADMGERPEGLTLERVLSDGWYAKNNCCWASRLDQARNREYTLDLTFGGRTMKSWEWAAELRVSHKTLHHRLWAYRSGQTTVDSVFKPNPRAK